MAVSEYELVLMLDPEAPDERRDEIAADARRRIESGGGELKAENAWGMRKLAYEIRQRTEADYRFFRFQTQSPVLDELDHNLKITDGVLRFRIFKVDAGSPVIEPPPPVSLSGSGPSRGAGGRRGGPQPGPAPREEAGDRGADRGATPEPAAAERAASGEAASEAPASSPPER